VAKRDKFSLNQCPKNSFEEKEMQKIVYASTEEGLVYAQLCTYLDIVYITRMLGRYLRNPRFDHLKIVKYIMWYLQEQKTI